MRLWLWGLSLVVGLGGAGLRAAPPPPVSAPAAVPPAVLRTGPANVTVLQLVQVHPRLRNYPTALPALLAHVREQTSANLDPAPDLVNSFEDPAIFGHPFIYVNAADRPDWTFTELEKRNLRLYLERGGFLFIDAGITASFLRDQPLDSQHHSFAEWEETPAIRAAFQTVFPGKRFKPLTRDHELYRCFYRGLPDAASLPETVRDYVLNEKWPAGTYSAVGLTVNGRLAVLCLPIVAMGWGQDTLGNWSTTIGFRIREGAKGLDQTLTTAAYSGERFETKREDGLKDIVYCQPPTIPAWVEEPGGHWRVFRYYHSREISEFAHLFYTQLGTNILVYALTH